MTILYAITKDSTGQVVDWGGEPLRTPEAGETAHTLTEANKTDRQVIREATPKYTTVSDGHFVAIDNLSVLKQERYVEIDARTKELIAVGFEFPPSSGQFFSMSKEAQIRIHGCDYARDLLTYPLKWQTLDDSGQLSITDAAAMHNFFLTALGTLRSVIDSGTDLKEQIADATTKAQVDAVVDPR